MRYEVFVAGTVRPQGSLSLWKGRDGRERAKYSQTTVVWRQTLHGAFSAWWAGRPPIADRAVQVSLLAEFARPKSHLGSGRNAGTVKPSAPLWHTVYPDLDKVARGVGDGLVEAGVLADDSLIASWRIEKRWCDPSEVPGASIVVEVL